MSSFSVFAAMARSMRNECLALRLDVPGFRTQPRTGSRTVRFREDGSATVAVSAASRPDALVAWDMAVGVCLVNRIAGWPSVFVAAALASEALAGALPERIHADLRNARVIKYPEHV